MKAKKYAVFFLISFSLFLVTPSLMHLIEDHIGISYIFNITEEEKKGEGESAEDTFVLSCYPNTLNDIYRIYEMKRKDAYAPDIYLSIIPDKYFPPPEYSA